MTNEALQQQPQLHRKVAVLTSGGMDSALLLRDLSNIYKEVYPVFIEQGLAWEQAELYWLKQLLAALTTPPSPQHPHQPPTSQGPTSHAASMLTHDKATDTQNRKDDETSSPLQPLTILQLPMADCYGNHWSIQGKEVPDETTPDEAAYLPGRNLILLVKTAVSCAQHDIPTIALGTLKGNPFPDSRPSLFKKFSSVLSEALSSPIQILTPYADRTKQEVMATAHDFPLHLTFSCLAPSASHEHCGACNKCAERQRVFAALGLPDPTCYTML